MLGRRDRQRSYFDAQSLPHRVPDDSFYGRMGAVCDALFRDDDLQMIDDLKLRVRGDTQHRREKHREQKQAAASA